MLLALSPLDHFQTWASGRGLEIVLIVTGALLLGRVTSWSGRYITEHIDLTAQESDALVRSEASKHRHALAQVATWATLVVIYCVTAVLVLQRVGVPIAGLVAPATVAGVALGFGAQRVVQDLLAGFFLITERQYGYGDVVRLTVNGAGTPLLGTVEDVTLRVTQMRTLNGEVVITPNGQIVQVTNLSRDWARAVLDIPVPSGADLNRVSDVLREVGVDAYADEDLRALLLDTPSVMGVESLEVDQLNIRMVARTLPGKQFDVGRELRSRAATALRREGLHVAPVLDTGVGRGVHVIEGLKTVRRSTWALIALFVIALVTYINVAPDSTPALPATRNVPVPAAPTATRTPTPTRSPVPTQTAVPAPSATPSPTVPRMPASPSVAPTRSAAPTPSRTTGDSSPAPSASGPAAAPSAAQ